MINKIYASDMDGTFYEKTIVLIRNGFVVY